MERISIICLTFASIVVIIAEFSDAKKIHHGRMNGQIMIGGLVMVHDSHGLNNVDCNLTDMNPSGIQRVEAMRYAVHQINKNKTILPGIPLGLEVHDTCGSETRALDESLQFITDKVSVCHTNTSRNMMFGVVGASTSLVTAAVANLLRLFRIPLVSYAATSIELSDKSKYNYLLRTVPPDNYQTLAMADFIKDILFWKSVYMLYSTGSYGEFGYEAFRSAVLQKEMNGNNTCIVAARKIPPNVKVEKMIEVLNDFLKMASDGKNKVRGIVCYCELHDIRTLVEAVESNKTFSEFRFIGSDNFVLGPVWSKAIIFSLHNDATDLSDFYENWFNKLTPNNVNSTENPWFSDYWETHCKNRQHNCTLCDYNESNEIVCPRDDKISYTIDAVYAFAHAINSSLKEYGGDVNKLKEAINSKTDNFFERHLKTVDFQGVSNRVQFNDSVMRGFYDINQFDSEGKLKVIGTWKSRVLKVNSTWEAKNFFVGNSSCEQECVAGEKKVSYKNCCWSCERCKPNDYVKLYAECKPCGEGRKPNSSFTGCVILPVRHITLAWQVVLYLITSCGVCATLFTIKTFKTYDDTPMVKASGRELSYVLLFGIIMLYCIPFLLLADPSKILCGMARFGLGLMLCICYSAILIKTNRIARIFSGRQNLLFLTPNWQLLLATFFLMPQILIGVIGLILHPPVWDTVYLNSDYGVSKCNSDTPDLIGSLVYNLILVFLCTYYAFHTRKVPANFNEARYIMFVMYTTCVLWLAFLPVFFGTNAEYKTVFIILHSTMNASTLLIGLFGFKVYIILFKPEKNARCNSKLRSITFCSEGNYSCSGFNTDGVVTIDSDKNDPSKNGNIGVRFHKSTTQSTLVQVGENINSSKEQIENTKENQKSELDLYNYQSLEIDVQSFQNSDKDHRNYNGSSIHHGNDFHPILHHTLTM